MFRHNMVVCDEMQRCVALTINVEVPMDIGNSALIDTIVESEFEL
jgi:hypothetical protein